MQAIRDAARRLGTRDLSSCEMHGTSRACPMCQAGAYWGGVSRLWYGESIDDGGVPRLPSLDAFDLIVPHGARGRGNAIIAMHYDADEIAPGVTEVLAYGTAVVIAPAGR